MISYTSLDKYGGDETMWYLMIMISYSYLTYLKTLRYTPNKRVLITADLLKSIMVVYLMKNIFI